MVAKNSIHKLLVSPSSEASTTKVFDWFSKSSNCFSSLSTMWQWKIMGKKLGDPLIASGLRCWAILLCDSRSLNQLCGFHLAECAHCWFLSSNSWAKIIQKSSNTVLSGLKHWVLQLICHALHSISAISFTASWPQLYQNNWAFVNPPFYKGQRFQSSNLCVGNRCFTAYHPLSTGGPINWRRFMFGKGG